MKKLFLLFIAFLGFVGCVQPHIVAKNTVGADITVINPYTDQMCMDLLEKRANLQVASYILTGVSLTPSITTPAVDSKPVKIGVAAGAATAALVGGGLAIKIGMLTREIERHCDVVPAPEELPVMSPLEIEL